MRPVSNTFAPAAHPPSPGSSRPSRAADRLAADVHAAPVDGDLILLKLSSDLYVCLPGAAASLSADGDRLRLADADLTAALREAGVLLEGKAGPPQLSVCCPVRDLPRPARDLLAAPSPAFGWRDLGSIARAVRDAVTGYWRKPLSDLVAEALAAAPSPRRLKLDEQLIARARRFQVWVSFAPAPGKCLLRAFLLLRHLRRHGQDARWVFGVKTWPFAAHCWLQVDDLVLDDAWERVAAYEPILVL